MTASAESRFRTKSPDALRRSRGAHQAALLFAAASNPEQGGYHASGAMQAIHISLAYREGRYDATLPEMATWLVGDKTKMENLLALGRLRHRQAGARPAARWETDTPGIIGNVFKLADYLLVVDEAVLLPYLSLHPIILKDLRKPVPDEKKAEVRVRNSLRQLAYFASVGRLSPDKKNSIWNIAAGADLVTA